MFTYRFPTSILWQDEGHVFVQAPNVDGLMDAFRARYGKACAANQSPFHAQVQLPSGRWDFASCVMPKAGGYAGTGVDPDDRLGCECSHCRKRFRR